MSAPWPKVRLGDVLRLDLDRVPIDASATYPMVGVLSYGRGLFEREPIVNGQTSYKFFCRLKADHVVMSQLFGWEGALALSSEQFSGRFLSPQFPTFICDQLRLDRGFLGWLIQRPTLWQELGSRASGMGDRRRTLNPEALLACEIPLPPLAEQRRIVARIDELAAHIHEARTLRQQVIEDLEILSRVILSADERAVKTPMKDLVRLLKPDVRVLPEGTFKFAGVYSFGRGLFSSQERAGMEFSYPLLTRLRTGDFTYPKLMAWEGAFGVAPEECDGHVVSTEFPVFEINQEVVLPEVLDVYFRSPNVWPEIAGVSTGTNVRRRRLNPKDFLDYHILLPSRETQLKLRSVKQQVEIVKHCQSASTAELDALLPSILDRAFAGCL